MIAGNFGIFLAILVLGGIFARILIRKIVYAFDPSARGGSNVRNKGTRVWLALADFAGWLFAFLIASEFIGLHLTMKLFIVMLILATIAVVSVIIAGLLAYSFNKEANELILSMIGYLYLKPGKNKPLDTREYDLGEGKQGKISEITLLHTTFN